MSEGEDRTEPGRARRHVRPPASQDDAPPQSGWPSRYGPRPDFTVPPDTVSTIPGDEQPPARPGRHGRQPGPGTQPGPGAQSSSGWGVDPYQDSGFDSGPAPY
ncbi:MAG TPA: hypothetical protein VGI21_03240, partial [Streptosporangiaceae bacterium]